jgi:hypothetical protein
MTKKTKIDEVTFQLPSGQTATVYGRKTLGRTDYLKIKYRGKLGAVPYELFVDKRADARVALKNQGVRIISDADWRAIVEAVVTIEKFTAEPLVEQPGWAGSYFALKDGTVFTPENKAKGKAIFERLPRKDLAQGQLSEWQTQIAVFLEGQYLPMVGVLAAFAAPLVAIAGETQNFGFELSGPPASGKSTWLALYASVAGKPSRIPTFNSTKAGLEGMFKEFRDMPFPIDEANLADSGDKQFMKDFAFRMANGIPKVTAFQPDRAQYRFVFATTANRPFYEALSDVNGDTSGAAL